MIAGDYERPSSARCPTVMSVGISHASRDPLHPALVANESSDRNHKARAATTTTNRSVAVQTNPASTTEVAAPAATTSIAPPHESAGDVSATALKCATRLAVRSRPSATRELRPTCAADVDSSAACTFEPSACAGGAC